MTNLDNLTCFQSESDHIEQWQQLNCTNCTNHPAAIRGEISPSVKSFRLTARTGSAVCQAACNQGCHKFSDFILFSNMCTVQVRVDSIAVPVCLVEFDKYSIRYNTRRGTLPRSGLEILLVGHFFGNFDYQSFSICLCQVQVDNNQNLRNRETVAVSKFKQPEWNIRPS